MIKSKTTKMWGKVKGCVRWQKTTPYSNHIENVLLWKWLMNMPQTWQTKTLICLFFQLKKHYYTYTYEKTNTWCKIILVFSFQKFNQHSIGQHETFDQQVLPSNKERTREAHNYSRGNHITMKPKT
jgi:hypothetical protein